MRHKMKKTAKYLIICLLISSFFSCFTACGSSEAAGGEAAETEAQADETAEKYWKEFDQNGGKYPDGVERPYETAQMIRDRVFAVLKKYENLKKVIVVSHGTLMRHCLNVFSVKNCEIFKWEGQKYERNN